jgi:hypothetical protein
MSKRIAQLSHSKRRALERFGVSLNMLDLQDIVKKIQNQVGLHIKRCSRSRSTWAVEHDGLKFYVAYDKNTKAIATIMPLTYAVCDVLKEALYKLKLTDVRNRYFSDDVRDVEDSLNLAYDLFKEVTR